MALCARLAAVLALLIALQGVEGENDRSCGRYWEGLVRKAVGSFHTPVFSTCRRHILVSSHRARPAMLAITADGSRRGVGQVRKGPAARLPPASPATPCYPTHPLHLQQL